MTSPQEHPPLCPHCATYHYGECPVGGGGSVAGSALKEERPVVNGPVVYSCGRCGTKLPEQTVRHVREGNSTPCPVCRNVL